MSTRRRERSQAPSVNLDALLIAVEQKVERKVDEAPTDSRNYVRIDGSWAIAPSAVASWGGIVGTLSNQTDLQAALDAAGGTWEAGTAYYDGAVALYVVYGADGNWQATRSTSNQTLSTAAAQTGTKPSNLTALRALSYS